VTLQIAGCGVGAVYGLRASHVGRIALRQLPERVETPGERATWRTATGATAVGLGCVCWALSYIPVSLFILYAFKHGM